MTARAAAHGAFAIERTYDAAPNRVFAAFATEEGKARWFSAPNDQWTLVKRAFDFRVGGREQLSGRWKDSGVVSDCQIHYWDIIENERIIYSYEMFQDGVKISVSLATLEFKPAGRGTRFILNESGVYLDGFEDGGGREHGTAHLIDLMGASL